MGEMTKLDSAALDRAVRARQLPAAVRAALADPLARISAVTVARDGGRRLDCYAVAGESGLAALTPGDNGDSAVSFPIEAKAIEALLGDTLGLDQPLAELGHSRELDIAALWALAALVDAHRQRQLESLLARTASPPPGVDDDLVLLRALDGATLADPRWLSSLLNGFMGPADATEARLRSGLEALEHGGLIGRDANGLWAPQSGFIAAFANLEVPMAGAQLVIERRSAGGVDRVVLAFVRTLAALWILQSRGPRVLLRSAGGADARAIIHDAIEIAIAPPSVPQPGAPMPPPAKRFCHHCGTPAAASDRFCGHCGTRLV
ncbi:zinc-ribbon domain-containing protein [Blastochloris sulfoviridis]|uniref:Zinc-ribbon domain-containing protein n=1 Tax=Blastochloris sulfoviridis TaxID=50712 RepID=A0A5M6HJE1_9HYPH|nr:zinc-ribbon domain-containing protein [Blastochloris sulfoviridis]KAA5595976.1 hypothetical protein F1193_15925 [Blastochloris sulfoviridis]